MIEDCLDPAFDSHLTNVQIWIKLLIETGSYVEKNDPSWNYYMVYEVEDSRYKFAGMLSYYPFYQSVDKKRIRLS